MAEFDIAVAGSDKDNHFVVVNFLHNPTNPGTVPVDTQFPSGGCVVDCYEVLAAVGNYMGDEVLIYNIVNPASPRLIGQFSSTLGSYTGIGALSIFGTHVLVGEQNGPNIVLFDISNPTSPSLVSSITPPVSNDFADGGISSIVLRGSYAVVAGHFNFDVFDFATPTKPTFLYGYTPTASNGNINFNARLSGIACDFDGLTAAFGDASGNVYVFGIVGGIPQFQGQSASPLFFSGGVTSVAVKGNLVAASSVGGGTVFLLDFGIPSIPLGEAILSNDAPAGAVRFSGSAYLVASTNNNVDGLTQFAVSSPPPTLTAVGVAKNANLNPASHPTMGLSAFTIGGGG
jgi:hypothetical protein